ncbi:MAG: VOC family protein [Candidatus Hodarchaeota archaeon]
MSEIKLEKFDQIGIVVRDIDKSKKMLETFLDFKKNLNIVEQSSTVIYHDKEVTFKMKKIMQTFGGKQFEICQVIESTGDHLYLEFLKEGKEGLHHLGIYTKDADKLIEHYKKEYYIDVIQTGTVGKVNFYYLDTKDSLGFYIELIAF